MIHVAPQRLRLGRRPLGDISWTSFMDRCAYLFEHHDQVREFITSYHVREGYQGHMLSHRSFVTDIHTNHPPAFAFAFATAAVLLLFSREISRQ